MNPSDWRRFGAAFVSSLAILAVAAAPAQAARQAFAEDAASSGELRHGSRSTATDGTLVVYDKVSGLYRVPRHDRVYWVGGRFYQFDNGLWQSAGALAGPWNLVAGKDVPEAAAARHLPPRIAATAKLPSGSMAVYEPRLKAYKVAGHKGVFVVDGTFYRYDGGLWLGAGSEVGPWAPASAKTLPPPLRRAVPAPKDGDKVTLPGGETLVFEGKTRLFAIEGKTDTVLFDGVFYLRSGDKWLTSKQAATGFEEVDSAEVPPPVRSNYHLPASDKPAKDKAKRAKPKEVNNKAGRVAPKPKDGQGKAGKPGKAAKPAGDAVDAVEE